MDILACSDPVVKMTVWQITDTIFSIFCSCCYLLSVFCQGNIEIHFYKRITELFLSHSTYVKACLSKAIPIKMI